MAVHHSNDKLIQEGIQSAADLGMYVIIDWHVLNIIQTKIWKRQLHFFRNMQQCKKTMIM